jgi:hypothetical protein
MPPLNLNDYIAAVGHPGSGPLADLWLERPAALVDDLIYEIQELRARIAPLRTTLYIYSDRKENRWGNQVRYFLATLESAGLIYYRSGSHVLHECAPTWFDSKEAAVQSVIDGGDYFMVKDSIW